MGVVFVFVIIYVGYVLKRVISFVACVDNFEAFGVVVVPK